MEVKIRLTGDLSQVELKMSFEGATGRTGLGKQSIQISIQDLGIPQKS
ncbi:MAG: hypothetical protein KAR05_08800 [Candidatus Omnitrophica bacterium]|nr:hypothetical protein [Candidatus Omnitrophota bacterium]